MQRATLHLKLTTPAFLGGADQQSQAEWRAASVRGQLRWWFRAIAGAVHGGDLRAVRRLETAAFGATSRRAPLKVEIEGNPSPHRSYQRKPWQARRFANQLAELWGENTPSADTLERLRIKNADREEVPSDPIDYLAYRPIDRGRLTRSFLEPGTRVKVKLVWRPGRGAQGEQVEALLRLAFWAWLHLGGIGARSRKGFGSLCCEEIDDSLPFLDRSLLLGDSAFAKGLAEIASRVPNADSAGLPEWSYFSPQTKVYVAVESHASWKEALLHGGAWLMAFRRRYGSPHDDRVHRGMPLRGRDYAWAEHAQPSNHKSPPSCEIPDRAGFGLPLPIFFSQKEYGPTKYRPTKKVDVAAGGHVGARRASPLLLHVEREGSSEHRLVLTHLPAALAPQGGPLSLFVEVEVEERGRRWKEKQLVGSAPPTPQQLGIVSHFLQDLESKALIREVKP